jgi:predicted HicB family RNase H-like nuclease
MFDPHAYAITVRKDEVDGEQLFRATIAELPDVEEYAPTYQEAYEFAIDAIETLQAMYEEEGRSFPTPSEEEREFSGRVTLRVPKSVHRQAATIAQAEGVSLNQWLVSTVALAVGNRSMLAGVSTTTVGPASTVGAIAGSSGVINFTGGGGFNVTMNSAALYYYHLMYPFIPIGSLDFGGMGQIWVNPAPTAAVHGQEKGKKKPELWVVQKRAA